MDEKQAGAALKIKAAGMRGRAVAGVDLAEFFRLLERTPFHDLSRSGRLDLIKEKKDKGSKVYRGFLDLGCGPEEVFIKTYAGAMVFRVMAGRMFSGHGLARPFHYPVKLLKLLFTPGTARRAWKAASACRAAGVPTAEQLCWLGRGFGLLRKEVMLSRGVNPRPADNARRFFESKLMPPLDREAILMKRELIKELGKVLAAVRKSRVMLPDLKLHNLVLSWPEGEKPRFFVVDFSEAKSNQPDYPELVFLRRFAARLPGFTKTDKIRLLKAYLEAREDPRSWKELCPLLQPQPRD